MGLYSTGLREEKKSSRRVEEKKQWRGRRSRLARSAKPKSALAALGLGRESVENIPTRSPRFPLTLTLETPKIDGSPLRSGRRVTEASVGRWLNSASSMCAIDLYGSSPARHLAVSYLKLTRPSRTIPCSTSTTVQRGCSELTSGVEEHSFSHVSCLSTLASRGLQTTPYENATTRVPAVWSVLYPAPANPPPLSHRLFSPLVPQPRLIDCGSF